MKLVAGQKRLGFAHGLLHGSARVYLRLLIPLALGFGLGMSYREARRAVWELLEYMVDTFTSLLSRVIMVVNVRLSDISGCIVLDLRYIYLVSLAASATTILLVGSWHRVHEQMLRDFQIFARSESTSRCVPQLPRATVVSGTCL